MGLLDLLGFGPTSNRLLLPTKSEENAQEEARIRAQLGHVLLFSDRPRVPRSAVGMFGSAVEMFRYEEDVLGLWWARSWRRGWDHGDVHWVPEEGSYPAPRKPETL